MQHAACSILYIVLIYLYLSQSHGVTHRQNLMLEPSCNDCASTFVVELAPRNEPNYVIAPSCRTLQWKKYPLQLSATVRDVRLD